MDIEQRMRTALHRGASGLQLPEAGPEAARGRARRRQRQRQAIAGGLTALLVGAVGVTGWQLLPEPSVRLADTERDGDGAVVASTPEEGVPASLEALEWRDAESVLGYPQELMFSDEEGVYYALSTAPGTTYEDYPEGDAPQALYRSTDGAEWEVVELGEKRWVADIAEHGGVLYAVSTAPATTGDGWGRAAVSTDGGESWSEVDLPAEGPDLGDNVPVASSSTTASVAVGDEVVLARTTTTHHLDLQEIFSAEELDGRYVAHRDDGLALMEAGCADAPKRVVSSRAGGMVATPSDAVVDEDVVEGQPVPTPTDAAGDGVQAGRPVSALEGLDCRPEDDELVRLIPWNEIGLEGRYDLTQTQLFRSTDGQTWEALDASALTGVAVDDLSAGPHGFVVSAYEPNGMRLLRSTDGTDWQEVQSPGDVTRVGFIGDRIVAFGAGDAVFTSEDAGATWYQTSFGELLESDTTWIQANDTGPLGAAAVLSTYDDARDIAQMQLAVSSDGFSWSVLSLDEVSSDGPPDHVSWVAVGADSITLSAVWFGEGEDGKATVRTLVGTPTR